MMDLPMESKSIEELPRLYERNHRVGFTDRYTDKQKIIDKFRGVQKSFEIFEMIDKFNDGFKILYL